MRPCGAQAQAGDFDFHPIGPPALPAFSNSADFLLRNCDSIIQLGFRFSKPTGSHPMFIELHNDPRSSQCLSILITSYDIHCGSSSSTTMPIPMMSLQHSDDSDIRSTAEKSIFGAAPEAPVQHPEKPYEGNQGESEIEI